MVKRPLLLLALAAVPTASAFAATGTWRPVVIERMTYVSTGAKPIVMALATDPIIEWPAEVVQGPNGAQEDLEARARLRVVGPPTAIGRTIRVDGELSCEDDYMTTQNAQHFAFTIKPGESLLLPASKLRPHKVQRTIDGVTCVWSIGVSAPTTGAGTHRATVELTVASPVSEVVIDGGGTYQREQCTVTLTGSSTNKTCKSI
jgi:hypothetical protein